MAHFDTFLATLRRPKLLVRAARHGLADYNRKRDLARLTGQSPRSTGKNIVETLIAEEEQQELIRRSGDTTYRPSHHIELLVALIAECNLLRRGRQQA